jgi:hypothetical protein
MANTKSNDGIQETEVKNNDVAESLSSAVNPDLPAGVPEGTVEKSENGDPELRDRIDYEEKIVYAKNDDGEVTGWYKMPADGSTPKEQDGVLTEEQAKLTEEDAQDKENN